MTITNLDIQSSQRGYISKRVSSSTTRIVQFVKLHWPVHKQAGRLAHCFTLLGKQRLFGSAENSQNFINSLAGICCAFRVTIQLKKHQLPHAMAAVANETVVHPEGNWYIRTATLMTTRPYQSIFCSAAQ
jgi:hypothetical protein